MKHKATNADWCWQVESDEHLPPPLPQQLCNDRATPPAGVRSKDGNLLTQEDLVQDRWKEHFQEVFNRPASLYQIMPEDCALTEDEDCFDIDTGPFTVEVLAYRTGIFLCILGE